MDLRTILIIFVLGALVLFTAVNWTAFTTPTTLSVIFASVEAPLGLILLGIVVLLTALFLVYVAYLQSSMLFESRRHGRELQTQRELADQAEASRFSRLQASLEAELRKLDRANEEARARVMERLDRLDRELRAAVEQSENTLAAYLDEIDDRLERAAGEPPARNPA